MVAKNDITGDAIKSRESSKKYNDGWDKIFGKDKENLDKPIEFWYHTCKSSGNVKISTQREKSCNWCGLKEDGSLD